MASCPYYFHYKQQPSANQRPAIPYCRHKHSPVPLHLVVDGQDLLRCGGDLQKCQVAPDKRLDLEA